MTDGNDLAAMLALALDDMAPSSGLESLVAERVRVRRARRRAVRAVATVAALVAVVGTAMVVNEPSDRRDRSLVTDRQANGLRWEEVLPPPLLPREDSSAIWTGTEVVVWGGDTSSNADEKLRADGAAYNPSTGLWRMLPEAPIGPRSDHVAVWTGTEMIVWGGGRSDDGPDGLDRADRDTAWSDGGAYNPLTNTWRRIPDAPIGARFRPGAAWTGAELVVVGGIPIGSKGLTAVGAAYDPSRNTWRLLPDAPLRGTAEAWAAWTGREILLWRPPGTLVLNGDSPPVPQLFAYDPESDVWRRVGPPPEFGVAWMGAAVEWTGSELVVLSESTVEWPRSHAQAVAYNPTTDAWRRVASSEDGVGLMPESDALWTGREVVAIDRFGHSLSALRPSTGTWTKLPEWPGGLAAGPRVATDDGDVYIFGREGAARLVRTPPTSAGGS